MTQAPAGKRSRRSTGSRTEHSPDRRPQGWRPLLCGLIGGVLLWAAFPPLGWWPLAWVAPLPWILLIMQPADTLRRPYRQLYLAGWATWLLLANWIRLPHWCAWFGWLALATYLGVYLPLFVRLTRELVHRWRWPVVWAAPVVWTGLELARGYLLTGFSLLLLGHSQVRLIPLLQIADWGGAYAVSFLVMLGAAAITQCVAHAKRGWEWWPLVTAVGLVAGVCLYGTGQIARCVTEPEPGKTLQVGLIQGSIDTRFDDPVPPSEYHEEYLRLSQKALEQHPELEVLVWPESIYHPYNEPLPPSVTWQDLQNETIYWQTVANMGGQTDRAAARRLGRPLIAGCPLVNVEQGQVRYFNSVISIAANGDRVGRYDKMHPVMFGEYVPLGNVFPWLYRLTPMGNGLTPGRTPICIKLGGLCLCPNICFENTVPHLVRRQVRELIEAGQSPDALITVTNDGWFWGSSLLDHHLACGVFRAIEMRRPQLIAANTGFSAAIDATGRILGRGPRRATGLVTATIGTRPASQGESLYVRWGDLPAGLCLAVTVMAAGTAVWSRTR